jgi:ribonuclease HI
MGFGVLIRRGEEELFSARRSEPASQRNSNNVAEYKSLIIALEWLEAIGYLETPVLVRGDSKLVIEQMSGRWKIKTGFYAAQARKAKELAARFKDIRYQWIPREENEKADSLSRKESPETA